MLAPLKKCKKCKCCINDNMLVQCMALDCWDISNKTCTQCLDFMNLTIDSNMRLDGDIESYLNKDSQKLVYLCSRCKHKNKEKLKNEKEAIKNDEKEAKKKLKNII